MKTFLKCAVTAVAAMAALGAQAKVSDGASYGAWKGVCKDNECAIAQVVNKKDALPGAVLIRKIPEANNQTVLVLTLPLGVNLQPGALLTIDGKDIGAIAYDVCIPEGCKAPAPLDDKIIAKLKAGKTLQVSAFVAGKKQSVKFSLSGITKALSNL